MIAYFLNQTKCKPLRLFHIFFCLAEQFQKRLNLWKKDDRKFVNIAAEKQVMKCILTENCVTIVGNSGTGKSFLLRHVALAMMDKGYIIIPCDNPGDIRQWFKPERNTLFLSLMMSAVGILLIN